MLPERPLWRRTPPAIFPICLGLLSLGLAWRNASGILPVAHEIGDVMLGFAMAFYLYFLAFYLRKLIARPHVLFEDMTNPPARAGIAAMAMSMMMLAAALLPFGIAAVEVWWLGVAMQVFASGVGVVAIWREPAGEREFTPLQYLTFVGPVVGPIAGIRLGHVWESEVLTAAALAAYVVITVGIAHRLLRWRPQFPLRPILVIFLAPNCLFATSYGLLGVDWAFWFFYWLSGAVAFALILLLPYLTKGGWTPFWSSFTFPAAAFAHIQLLALSKGGGALSLIGAYASLSVASVVIALVTYRAVMAWVTGELAQKTLSATA